MPTGHKKSYSYESMGTHWEISVWEDVQTLKKNAEKLIELFANIERLSQEFDDTYSRFISTSRVMNDFTRPGEHNVDSDFIKILELYKKYFVATKGKLNPLIGNALSEAGYDKDYNLQKEKKLLPGTPHFLDTLEILDEKTIRIKKPVIIDIGALGKGFFVEVIADFLKENGIETFLVNGSGDMYFYNGNNPNDSLTVGLEHPDNEKMVIGTMQLPHEFALCSSGTNRRKWGEYHHILDPDTKKSPTEILSVWVMHKHTADADALATSLFFTPPEALLNDEVFEYAILHKDMSLSYSSNFNLELF